MARGAKRFLPDARRTLAIQFPEEMLAVVNKHVRERKGKLRRYSRSEFIREAVAKMAGVEWKPVLKANVPPKLGVREVKFLKVFSLVKNAYPNNNLEQQIAKVADTQGITFAKAKTYLHAIRNKGVSL
jgi:hypothetical protein